MTFVFGDRELIGLLDSPLRLGLPADLSSGLGREVLHADLDLLADRVRVQLHERLEQILGLLPVLPRVVLDLFEEVTLTSELQDRVPPAR